MKSLVFIIAMSMTLSGCAGLGPYLVAHQTTIIAVGAAAAVTSSMTSTAVNVVALEKEIKK